jgi:hypothetical protein
MGIILILDYFHFISKAVLMSSPMMLSFSGLYMTVQLCTKYRQSHPDFSVLKREMMVHQELKAKIFSKNSALTTTLMFTA